MRVRGEGPVPSEIMFVGEGPGWEEDKAGRPFVGKTGQELERYLDGDTLPLREDVYLTNIYRYYGGKKYIYTPDDLKRDEPELLGELRMIEPKLIITLGRHATRYFLGDVDMDDTQGIAWELPPQDKFSFMGPCTIFPIVHPAAGFHNAEMSPYVVMGFQELARFLAGNMDIRRLHEDGYPEPHYEEIKTLARLKEVLKHEVKQGAHVHLDTEGSLARPWSLQFCARPGTGYLIRASADRNQLFQELCQHFVRVRATLTYHSSLHDLGINRSLGVEGLNHLAIDDTMVMAYLLQLMPQGLKPLAGRIANMKMESYDDVLGDARDRIALDYAVGLIDIEHADWERRCQDAFWAKVDEGRRVSKIPELPKTSLHKAAERILRAKDPYKLWHKQVEDIRVAGYNRLGEMPEATLSHVEPAKAIYYACRDADATARVRPELEERIDSLGLRSTYNLELGTYPLIDRMQQVGIKPDLDHFARLSEELQAELDSIQAMLVARTGRDTFNANSGDQVAEFLFEENGLEGFSRTDSGRFSTNDKVLEALEHEFPNLPVISDIRSYREVYKLKNTFVDRIPDFVRHWPRDGRVHSEFRTTRVVTGRLAASNPNVLAMPKHGKFATDFRRGWVAAAGHFLYSWDLSQIGLRVLAHLSQDPVMLGIFRGEMRNPDGSKIDMHGALAERIFGVKPKDQDKSKHRLPAKAINFGLPMGMTYKGLTVELRKNGVMVSEDDAQRWIDETMALYKGVPIYMDRKKAEARQNGFVRCLSGRIRYIGGIRSTIESIRAEAERFAFSTPIQEGAQWQMKQAEAYIWKNVILKRQAQGQWIEPILQIHDDMVLEGEERLARDLNQEMVYAMTKVPQGLSVPIETSGDAGHNWADMEEIAA